MSWLDSLKSFLGLQGACPRCAEALTRTPICTVPFDEKLELINELMMLGRVREDETRQSVERIFEARQKLPRDVASGVRASLELCDSCQFGALRLELIQAGKTAQTKRHAAASVAYKTLRGFLRER